MAKKRFQDQVQIRPIDINLRTGAARGMMSLAERLGAFERLGQGIAQAGFDVRAREQIEAGKAAAEGVQLRTPEGELRKDVPFREAGILNRREVEAYNKTLAAGYKASIENDNRDRLTQLYVANKDNVLAFNDEAKAYYNGVVSEVDPYVRAEVAQDLEKQISLYSNRIRLNVKDKGKADAKATLEVGYQQSAIDAAREARLGNTTASKDYLVKSLSKLEELKAGGFYDAEKYEKIKRGVEREATEQGIRYDLDQKSIEDNEKELINIADKVRKGWTPDEWDTFIKSARADLNYRKTIERAAIAERSDATENIFFDKLLKGELTETDIANGEFDSETKRIRWYNLKNSQSDRADTARRAAKNELRSDINFLHTQETRAKAEIQTTQEQGLDALYSNNKLTNDIIDRAQVPASTKRIYRGLLEKKLATAKKRQEELIVESLDAEILSKLGTWDNKDLLNFMERGLPADDVYQWQQRNTETKNDKGSFRHNPVYKSGHQDLQFWKKNYLYINKTDPSDDITVMDENTNTERFLEIVKQYDYLCTMGMEPKEALKTVKQPFIDIATRGWMQRVKDRFQNKDLFQSIDQAAERRAYPTLDAFKRRVRQVPGQEKLTDAEIEKFYKDEYGTE